MEAQERRAWFRRCSTSCEKTQNQEEIRCRWFTPTIWASSLVSVVWSVARSWSAQLPRMTPSGFWRWYRKPMPSLWGHPAIGETSQDRWNCCSIASSMVWCATHPVSQNHWWRERNVFCSAPVPPHGLGISGSNSHAVPSVLCARYVAIPASRLSQPSNVAVQPCIRNYKRKTNRNVISQ